MLLVIATAALAYVHTPALGVSRVVARGADVDRACVSMGRRGQPPAFMDPKRQGGAAAGGAPPLPDDGLPVFYLFVRSPDIGLWYPVSAFKGDKPTRALVDSYINNGLGSEMAKSQLIGGIAKSLFNPTTMKGMTEAALKQYKPLKSAKDRLEWGFKIGDKALDEKVKAGEMEEPKIMVITEDMADDNVSKVQNAVSGTIDSVRKMFGGGDDK